MIKIISHFTIKEGKLNEAMEVFKDVIEKTRSLDTGFSEYDLYQDESNPLELAILETWESKEAIDAHSAKEHTSSMGARLQPLTDSISFGFFKKIL